MFLLVLLGGILVVMMTWRNAHPEGGIFDAVLMTFVAVMFFVFVDLVIVDWLFICTLRPKRIVLSGSADCAGWRDYMFHVTEQFSVRGISALVIMSFVVGTVAWLLT